MDQGDSINEFLHDWWHYSDLHTQLLSLVAMALFLYLVRAVFKQQDGYVHTCDSEAECEHFSHGDRRLPGGVAKFPSNPDRFRTLNEVKDALRKAGLESANLIFGIDFTASNDFQGAESFGGRSLHDLRSGGLNPYQSVIITLGETMEAFQTDGDGHIPAFGFGDFRYKNGAVFPLGSDDTCCGFQGVFKAYCHRACTAQFSGPTNFAPLIEKAVQICRATRSYHILVIVADGQVVCERETVEAIEMASLWPLSIITIGVGDGPWDMMVEFDKQLPKRQFDNFRFVNYHAAVSENRHNPEIAFAVAVLMEIPDQYTIIRRLGLLDSRDTEPSSQPD